MAAFVTWLTAVVLTGLLIWLAARFYQKHRWLVRSVAPSAAVLALGAGILIGTGQGRDLGLALLAAGLWQQAAFFAALVYWALATWHNARFPLDRAHRLWLEDRKKKDAEAAKQAPRAAADCEPDTPEKVEGETWRRWTPRVLGLAVFGIALVHLALAWRAGGSWLEILALAGLVLVLAASYLGFVVRRHDLGQEAKRRIATRSPAQAARLARAFEPVQPSDRRLTAGHALSTRAAYGLFFGIAGLITVTAWLHPVAVGEALGSMALGFVAFGAFLSGLVLLWGFAERVGWRLPVVVAALLVIATVVSLTRHYHPVRDCRELAGCREQTARVGRPSLDQAAVGWYAQASGRVADGAPVPMIVVATAGGGLRAAYWTAAVMGSLPEAIDLDLASFEQHLFAVSGVSGGSVGAAFRAALVAESGDAAALDGALKAALTRDFLAPVLASLAFVDIPSWVLPRLWQTSRGVALEKSFERATGGRLDRPFLDFGWQPGQPWRPLLLLNATHQETGRRVIAGHVRIDRDPFLDSFDLHALMGVDLRLSTAAHNSARFSYVSPAGRLATYPGDEGRGWIIDGGYFENFAALTALDLVRGALAAIDRAHGSSDRVQPVIIQISSDPGIGRTIHGPAGKPLERRDRASLGEFRACGGTAAALAYDPVSDKQAGFLPGNQLLAPLRGVMGSRQAHGVAASKELARFACSRQAADLPAAYAHFAMCPSAAPPLGWVLSPEVKNAIDGYRQNCGNDLAYAAVREAFAAVEWAPGERRP